MRLSRTKHCPIQGKADGSLRTSAYHVPQAFRKPVSLANASAVTSMEQRRFLVESLAGAMSDASESARHDSAPWVIRGRGASYDHGQLLSDVRKVPSRRGRLRRWSPRRYRHIHTAHCWAVMFLGETPQSRGWRRAGAAWPGRSGHARRVGKYQPGRARSLAARFGEPEPAIGV